jgi:hypothetical protein
MNVRGSRAAVAAALPPLRARSVSGARLAFPQAGYMACMNEEPRSNVVAAVVEAIDERSASQTNFIMAALVRGAWPGGVADRREPGAIEWLRRWGPSGTAPPFSDCSCIDGRCAVCN